MKFYKIKISQYRIKKLFQKIGYINIFIFLIYIIKNQNKSKKRIGVINLFNSQNVGNILVKFSLYNKLKEFGFEPIMIAYHYKGVNIDFLNRTVKLKIIQHNFTELKENDYDFLILNSDQTWAYYDKNFFYDNAFFKFAQNWTLPKFVYGASMGNDKWIYSKKDDEIAANLVKNFNSISFREKGMIKLAKEHLNINSVLVLDPTFLINKKYYLNEIKNYKKNFNFSENYLLVYVLDNNKIIQKIINKTIELLNYKIYNLTLNRNDYVENFIFRINNSKAVITDSYHGTVFSIIFNKPFLSYVNINRGKGRFDSLRESLNLSNRIINPIEFLNANINLLKEPLNLNEELLQKLKNFSIMFLKKNLGIY